MWACAAAGVPVLGLLAWWQRDLARRYRRLLNPALLAATACALAAVIATTAALASVADDMATARESGLRPWERAAHAEALAAEAGALQSRWLAADRDRAPLFRRQFAELSRRLADPGPGEGSYARRLSAAVADGTPMRGLLVPSDRAVLDRFAVLHRDDDRLTDLVERGRRDEAAQRLTEVPRGHLAFDHYDLSLHMESRTAGRAAVFTSRTGAAEDTLGPWPALPAALSGLALLAVPVAVRPRLAEYR
jgi:hypothetical protein